MLAAPNSLTQMISVTAPPSFSSLPLGGGGSCHGRPAPTLVGGGGGNVGNNVGSRDPGRGVVLRASGQRDWGAYPLGKSARGAMTWGKSEIRRLQIAAGCQNGFRSPRVPA